MTTTAGTFAVQPLWSNAANGCSSFPAAPSLSDGNGGIACPSDTLEWPAVPGATSYQVWEREWEPAKATYFVPVWSGTPPSYRFTLPRSYGYTYAALACGGGLCSALSNYDTVVEGTCQ